LNLRAKARLSSIHQVVAAGQHQQRVPIGTDNARDRLPGQVIRLISQSWIQRLEFHSGRSFGRDLLPAVGNDLAMSGRRQRKNQRCGPAAEACLENLHIFPIKKNWEGRVGQKLKPASSSGMFAGTFLQSPFRRSGCLPAP
jgi:hypothetical protein